MSLSCSHGHVVTTSDVTCPGCRIEYLETILALAGHPVTEPFSPRTRRCRIKDGWEGEGTEGDFYFELLCDQYWSIVRWDGQEDPDLFKSRGLIFL